MPGPRMCGSMRLDDAVLMMKFSALSWALGETERDLGMFLELSKVRLWGYVGPPIRLPGKQPDSPRPRSLERWGAGSSWDKCVPGYFQLLAVSSPCAGQRTSRGTLWCIFTSYLLGPSKRALINTQGHAEPEKPKPSALLFFMVTEIPAVPSSPSGTQPLQLGKV